MKGRLIHRGLQGPVGSKESEQVRICGAHLPKLGRDLGLDPDALRCAELGQFGLGDRDTPLEPANASASWKEALSSS